MTYSYYDFFAGGGMAGVGLGPGWRCLFANEIDHRKSAAYRANHHGGAELLTRDVAEVASRDLPGAPDLVWGSFPCQDLSLAGRGAGLSGARSGMVRPFWFLMRRMHDEGRAPAIIALENVCGALSSHGGRDFAALGEAFSDLGYRFGAMVIDAALFVPQSRPRMFIIGLRDDIAPPAAQAEAPHPDWHSPALIRAQKMLSPQAAARWLWLAPPAPPPRNTTLETVLEPRARWRDAAQTRALLALMAPAHREKVAQARRDGPGFGTVYRRTRPDGAGGRTQRAEARFDGLAGCLRTPAGGSSRQTLIRADARGVRTRLLTPRETARLMGLPEHYKLPERATDAYRLIGDGVAVPVVRHLAETIFEPALARRA